MVATKDKNHIVIEPVTRVEGHGKVTIHLDENRMVDQARLHIVEFRGFERFIQGRPYWQLPVNVLFEYCPHRADIHSLISHFGICFAELVSVYCDAFFCAPADKFKYAFSV